MKVDRTILLVEDSVLVADRLTQMLLSIQPHILVIHATSSREASAILSQTAPDLVLLDISLPDKSGIELLREIRRTDKQLAIIMVTNHAGEAYRKTCTALGACRFIDKSADSDCIMEMLAVEIPAA